MYTHIKAQEVRLAAESADQHNPLHHLYDAAFQTCQISIYTNQPLLRTQILSDSIDKNTN